MRLKKGDTVRIITGKDRGKQGKILEVSPQTHLIVVENLNLRTKNVRARRQNEKGQRVQYAAPLNVSNVLIVCSKCGQASRLGMRVEGQRSVRFCRRCQATL